MYERRETIWCISRACLYSGPSYPKSCVWHGKGRAAAGHVANPTRATSAAPPALCALVGPQATFQEYLALSDTFVTTSIAQGSTDELPLVRMALNGEIVVLKHTTRKGFNASIFMRDCRVLHKTITQAYPAMLPASGITLVPSCSRLQQSNMILADPEPSTFGETSTNMLAARQGTPTKRRSYRHELG